jgi:hypothetical protein
MRKSPSAVRTSALIAALVLVCSASGHLALGDVIEGTDWLPIGPAPLASPGQFFTGGWAGRASAIAANPFDSSDVWVGTANGGVWHTTDLGTTWRAMSDHERFMAIGALALAGCDVNGCDTIYAGTGENAIRRNTYYGGGLMVGTLASGTVPGVDWDLRDGGPLYDFTHGSIFNVVLDEDTSGQSQVIYITLSSGVTASASESTVTAPEPAPGGYGIYKSSDNGQTWAKLTVPGAVGAKPTDLELDQQNDILYAGFAERGVFKSSDGGASWCPFSDGTGETVCAGTTGDMPSVNGAGFDHVEIALYRGDPQTIYVTLGHCPEPLFDACTPTVMRSTNGGQLWDLKSDGAANPDDTIGCPAVYSRYTHGLAVHPSDPDTVFLGGLHLCASDNGGITFSDSDTNTIVGTTHLDHRQILFHATDANVAYEVSDGGFSYSTDSGSSWTPANDDLQITQFQGIGSSALSDRLLGGAQDNGGSLWTGTRQWDQLNCCGDGGYSIMDADDAMWMYITSNTSHEQGNNVIKTFEPLRSTDGGTVWENIAGTIAPTEPRAFYPPFVQGPGPDHRLYFGTNRLYMSDNDGDTWTAISPVLSNSAQPEIYGGQDVITAIGVAPGNQERIYLGYYGGDVFVTDSACTQQSCWPEKTTGLSGEPVTWIAVHPTQQDTAYLTLSGFSSGMHTYKTTTGGGSWSKTASTSALNGIPANTIAIEPDDPARLWLGTDRGVFKSENSGGSWFRVNAGMPKEVPVFQFSIDDDRGRIYAATHGRSAFVLSRPFLSNYEGWVNGMIWDVPMYGHNFLVPDGTPCTMYVIRHDGSVCASGTVDANGGNISVEDGVLVTDKNSWWEDHEVAWACLNTPQGDSCVGGADISECNQAGNPLSAVLVNCAGQVGFHNINGCPTLAEPPSALLSLLGLDGDAGALASLPPGGAPASESATTPASGTSPAAGLGKFAGGTEAAPVLGSFDVIASVQVGNGSTRSLCRINVPFQGASTAGKVLSDARDALNADATCAGATVSAFVDTGKDVAKVEDEFPLPATLGLNVPGVTGSQVLPAVHAAPGQTTGLCFRLDHLGTAINGQVSIGKIRFETAAGGAAGGLVTIVEGSSLGACAVRVPTAAGDTAGIIAQKTQNVFQTQGIPGPHPQCPAARNPRDVVRHGDAVVTVLPSTVQVCVNDPRVGFYLGPEEMCFSDADCASVNPCARNFCDLTRNQCLTVFEPDGTICEDNNPCTEGRTCQAGTCGKPIVCNDNDLCTADRCEPSTGACLFKPIVCLDANPCTRDSCDPRNGACLFTPTPGATCNDGNLCTQSETCVSDTATGGIVCRGQPKCADGNLCTVDRCDARTGVCLNEPLDCDDGNACTRDSCNGNNGACLYAPLTGATCDDRNACTVNDHCVLDPAGLPVCAGGGARVCDDGVACTIDSCNPLSGCVATPVQPQEVGDALFSDALTLRWLATPDAALWNTYRGTIPRTLLGSRLPASPYDQACFESDNVFGDGPLVCTDRGIPPLGTAWYYLVTGENFCGESILHRASSGFVVPNTFACPTPP